MSMYGIVHGQNSLSDIILACLDLTRNGVGRFRDAHVANGEIAIYTRNGGGNRDCWDDACAPEDERECHCVGCIISFHLPKHPHYLRDEDDDFDHTYATIYFRIPPEHAELLAPMERGEWKPDERWHAALEARKAGKRSDFVEALRPVIERIAVLAGEETKP